MPLKNIAELSTNNIRKKALEALNSALVSITPRKAVRDHVQTLSDTISESSRMHVFGFGKAVAGMYSGFREVFESNIENAVIIVPADEESKPEFPELQVLRGTHPFPSEQSLESSIHLVNELEKCRPGDTPVFLISGGGSSLFEIPAGNFTIEEISQISECIMDNDASIDELNRVRITLSSVKGGKLLKHIHSEHTYAFYISDVMSNDLHYIASGPLVQYDETGSTSVFQKYASCFSAELNSKLQAERKEAPSATQVHNSIVLSNRDFVSFLERKLETEKPVLNLGYTLRGDVNQLAKNIMSRLRNEHGRRKSDFWFAGAGESSVRVSGSGKGGRNQELCLHILASLRQDEKILFVSAGTDGIDGNSIAMGGIVDHETLEDSGVNEMQEYIDRNDSYTFLSEHNGAIISGRTGNNVSDVMLGHYAMWSDKSQV